MVMPNVHSDEERSIKNFFQRIRKRKDSLSDDGVPAQIQPFILFDDLSIIYDAVLGVEDLLTEQFESKKASPDEPINVRMDKEEMGLPRTINIIKDINGEYILLLETKSKLASGAKDIPRTPTFEGSSKKGKPSWRIDSDPPEEWINMVVKKVDEKTLKADAREATISQTLAKGKEDALNYSLVSERYQKRGEWKQGYYSPRAIGTLHEIIAQGNLSKEDKDRIAISILQGIKSMHDKNYVHQDIKSTNILIYKDKDGKMFAKITDYGLSDSLDKPTKMPVATLKYESPELSYLYEDQSYGDNSNYFMNKEHDSYGREIKEANKAYFDAIPRWYFGVPDKSNDMWAAGVVLFCLYHDHGLEKPSAADKKLIRGSELLSKLLEVKRAKRINVDDAIKLIPKPGVVVPAAQVVALPPAAQPLPQPGQPASPAASVLSKKEPVSLPLTPKKTP